MIHPFRSRPRPWARGAVALITVMSLVGLVSGTADAEASGTITVRAVGDRDPASGAPLPLEGATLRAHADASLTSPVGECTTDAAGTCAIAGLAPGMYWIAQAGDPPGYGGAFHAIDEVKTSAEGSVRYAEAVAVTEGDAMSRPLAYRRANPPFPERCGVRIALLYDLSGSISADEATIMQHDSKVFVDALAGTPSSISVASFATAAPAAGNTNLELTSVASPAGVDTVKAAIEGLTRTAGENAYTNWDAAFRSIPAGVDIAVMFTDGNPTVHGVPAVFPPVITGFDQIESGVVSANLVKARGTRILAVGVGDVDDISARNLQAISGPVEGSDYAITSFADLGAVFHRLADALCGGTVVVPKQVPEEPEGPRPVVVPPRFTG